MKKIILALTIATLFVTSNSEAAKIDRYREIIESRSFTIRYEIEQPPMRESSKEGQLTRTEFLDKKNKNNSQILENQRHSGIFVSNGDQKYIEQSRNFVSNNVTDIDKIKIRGIGICNLIQGVETTKFEYIVDKRKNTKNLELP